MSLKKLRSTNIKKLFSVALAATLLTAHTATADQSNELVLTDEQKILRPFLVESWGIVTPTPIDAHLNAIMAKLAAQSSIAAPPIYVVPLNQFSAECGAEGGIVVTTGLLEYLHSQPGLANDDALAFVLAHELSHVTLGHTAQREQTKQFISSIAGLSLVGGVMAGGYGAEVGKTMALAALGETVAGGSVLFPSWSREQELAADAAAVDLMVKAGYSPAVIPDMMAALIAAEGPPKAKQDIFSAQKQPDGRTTFQLRLGDLFKRAADSVGKDHPSASDRDEAVRKYVLAKYDTVIVPLHAQSYARDAARPPVIAFYRDVDTLLDSAHRMFGGEIDAGAARIAAITSPSIRNSAMARLLLIMPIYIHQGEKAALPPVLAALNDPYAIERAYMVAARIQRRQQDLQGAYTTLKVAYARFGDPRLLVYLNWLAMQTHDSAAGLRFLLACTQAGDMGLLMACSETSKREPPWEGK
jgi:Zn-dependent protease with chaperone function